MNLNGQSSKNKGTILNGKPLYGYDNAKKMRYQSHIFKHRTTVQKWRKDSRMSDTNKLIMVLGMVVMICILSFLIVFVFGNGYRGVIMFILIPILIIVGICIFYTVRIVPQTEEYVIEFLGRYKTTWSAGIHFLIPFFERVACKATSKEQCADFEPQSVITKDNVSIYVDTVVYFKIFDSKLFAYGAANPLFALENLAATTLRNLIGDMTLDEALTSRDTINVKLKDILDEATDPWGINVSRVELKNIDPPTEIKNAMEKQMKAEREKREKILQAEAFQESEIKKADG